MQLFLQSHCYCHYIDFQFDFAFIFKRTPTSNKCFCLISWFLFSVTDNPLALQHDQFWVCTLSDNFAYLICTHKDSHLDIRYYPDCSATSEAWQAPTALTCVTKQRSYSLLSLSCISDALRVAFLFALISLC